MARRIVALCACIVAALAGATGGPAGAQAGAPAWNFDTGLQGWTVNGLWAADGTPPLLLPVPPAPEPGVPSAFSPPNSLNYNNGVDYNVGGNAGSATSPAITVTAVENFGFRCAYDTEKAGDDLGIPPEPPRGAGDENVNIFDLRFVRVRNAQGNIVWERQYLADDGQNPPSWGPQPLTLTFEDCGPRGEWHIHFFQIQPAWGAVTVEFRFETGLANVGGPGAPFDPNVNDHTGWFIDDVAVSQSAPGGPSGSGDNGGLRDNANGDESANDSFGESWCGAAGSRSGLAILACLVVLAGALLLPRR